MLRLNNDGLEMKTAKLGLVIGITIAVLGAALWVGGLFKMYAIAGQNCAPDAASCLKQLDHTSGLRHFGVAVLAVGAVISGISAWLLDRKQKS